MHFFKKKQRSRLSTCRQLSVVFATVKGGRLMRDVTVPLLNDDNEEEPFSVTQRNCFWDNIDDNESVISIHIIPILIFSV